MMATSLALQNPYLLRSHCFINGEWCAASAQHTFAVNNPATGEIIAQVADATIIDARRAIDAAVVAQKIWAQETAQTRSRILRRWFDLVLLHQDDLARIITWEQGKPLAEARAEVVYGASYIEWYAEEAKRIYGEVIAPPGDNKRVTTIKQPVGVVAAITPWNFPNAMLARKLAPALAAGCAIVAKPAAETPLSALALAYLAAQAGIPAGVLNVICTADAAAIGTEFTAHSQVRKLSFTGSTAVGKKLIAQCAAGVKKITLELGGNAPFIVFADADMDAAVKGAIAAKFRNAGQTCICANRFYIHRDVYEEFAQKFIAAVAQLHIGDGFAAQTSMGPLISPKAIKKVQDLVADALSKGAQLAYQTDIPGQQLSGEKIAQGYFYPAQVLTQVSADAQLLHEEIFGPVAALVAFTTEEEVIALANDTEFGLAAYCYTRDAARSWRLSAALETGMVGMNTGSISNAMAPFGGIKQSGWGREGSHYGIEDYVNIKYICESF